MNPAFNAFMRFLVDSPHWFPPLALQCLIAAVAVVAFFPGGGVTVVRAEGTCTQCNGFERSVGSTKDDARLLLVHGHIAMHQFVGNITFYEEPVRDWSRLNASPRKR